MSAIRGFTWLLLLQTLGELLARALHLPFPGPVVGMAALVLALAWPSLRRDIEAVASLLLSHLSLLFVPVGVGVISHLDRLQDGGLRLALVVVLSTWVGMAVTAATLRALWPRSGQETGHGAAHD